MTDRIYRYYIAATLILCCSTMSYAQSDVFVAFDQLNTRIRDQKISRQEAIQLIKKLTPQVTAYYEAHRLSQTSQRWVFPLKGYTAAAIGGRNGSGYIASGYNFLDGNKHGGHPAHDIFIHDTNQDCIDDRNNKEVPVLACCDGIVIATETHWAAGSEQRGGNYIWVYAPDEHRLIYYAHNKTVQVKPGDILTAGQPIATVGRSGANAAKKRSPTHLHFMVLKLNSDGLPQPENCYTQLTQATTL